MAGEQNAFPSMENDVFLAERFSFVERYSVFGERY